MKGFRQAMLPEQMLKSTSTMDQMTKKTPEKVGSEVFSERSWRRRTMVATILGEKERWS